MQALSVDAEQEISHQQSLTAAVIESLAHKFGRRREQLHAKLRRVNSVAILLRGRTRSRLEQDFNRLSALLSDVAPPQINISNGGPDHENANWYKFEVIQSANASGKFANFSEAHYFITIRRPYELHANDSSLLRRSTM